MPGEQCLDTLGGERMVQQPAGGEPDRDRDRVAGAVARRGLLDGLLQLPAVQLRGAVAVVGEPAAVADPQEFGRGEEDALGGAPAGVGRDRGDPAAGQLHHRLVQQRERTLVQGRTELGGEFGAVCHLALHLGGVQLHPALAGLLGAVHREVGVAQQARGAHTGVGEGYADAGRHPYVPSVDAVGLGELDAQPVGDLVDAELTGGPVAGAVAGDQRGELVAAQPRRYVPGAHRVTEPAGGLHQQFVARLMADGVIDLLEAVEVDVEHGGVVVAGPAAGDGLGDALGEQRAVGQVGERVVRGVVLELGL